MTWERVDKSDIAVQSDADGYSEDVTVVDGETVHVDSHAEASASASASLTLSEDTFGVNAGNNRRIIAGAPFENAHVDATVGPVSESGADFWVSFGGQFQIAPGWIDQGQTRSWSGTIGNLDQIRVKNLENDKTHFQFDIEITEIGDIASATVDSTTVVTDKITTTSNNHD